MKKIRIATLISLLILSFIPVHLKAEMATTTAPTDSTKTNSAEAQVLFSRIEEIKALDKPSLKPAEKKSLRKEVKSIKKQLKELDNGGIYLSIGAIIIIILLLIILL